MNISLNNRLIKYTLITALASLLQNSIFILLHWYSVSSIGYGGLIFIQFGILLLLPFLGYFGAIPASIIFLILRKTRKSGAILLSCALIYIVIGFPLVMISQRVRMNAFHNLADRSSSLISAIYNFSENEGHPPNNLQKLLPKYLSEIPGTDMPAYPEYSYITDDSEWDGNPWVLLVHCSSGGINFDMFVYFPKQNYPETGYGGNLEKIGKWAYIHE